ncbi:protein disulfide-isomerase [Malassezia brasiliensis]|uniref:Protein disulfide-isomerase n=1 Tax=Malassezia brasiliensis TaxID=1821822 RepID=A0AAF0INM6_9BASI|nr:protein disulfide-isomerase [Malassezia brasiliensis]
MLRLAVLVACVSAALAQAALFAPQSPVLKLTPANFDKEILQIDKPAMVAFTAPWCGHCKNLAPQYQRVAAELDGVVKIAYVDCDDRASESLCAKYNVRGFPSLKLFPSTKKRLPRDYNGERSANAITEYVVSALPAESVRRLDVKKLPDFLKKDPDSPKVLLVSPKSKSSPMYRSLALDFRGRVPFGYLYALKDEVFGAVKEALGVTLDIHRVPALYIVTGPPGTPKLHKYRGAMKYKHIRRWLDEAIDGKVAPEEPEEPAPKEEPKPVKNSPEEEFAAFKEAGLSDEQAHAAVRLAEQLQSSEDAKAHLEAERKATKEKEARRRQVEALRRASAKLKQKGNAAEVERDPMTGEMLMDKMQDLIGDKWGSSLAALTIEAKEKAEKIISENPAKAMYATQEAEKFLLDGINEDIRAIEDQLTAGADDEGYPLTKDMEESMRKHHDLLTGMIQTINLRQEARNQKKSEAEIAEEVLARFEL